MVSRAIREPVTSAGQSHAVTQPAVAVSLADLHLRPCAHGRDVTECPSPAARSLGLLRTTGVPSRVGASPVKATGKLAPSSFGEHPASHGAKHCSVVHISSQVSVEGPHIRCHGSEPLHSDTPTAQARSGMATVGGGVRRRLRPKRGLRWGNGKGLEWGLKFSRQGAFSREPTILRSVSRFGAGAGAPEWRASWLPGEFSDATAVS